MSNIDDYVTVSPAMLRLVTLLFQVTFIAHILSCFWFFVTTFDERGANNWWRQAGLVEHVVMVPEGGVMVQRFSVRGAYLAALYWSFTTMTTVGYGDIVAVNDTEKMYAPHTARGGHSLSHSPRAE